MKRFIAITAVLLVVCSVGYLGAADRFITIASTTSTYNSGLFDYIHPVFTKDTGIKVRVVAKGTGASIRLAQECNADVIVVHAKQKELKFVREGYGVKRFDLMYNDFIIVGSAKDPAGIKGMKSAPSAFKKVAKSGNTFASRGDNSGTHTKEKNIWKKAGVNPSGGWYKSLGQGMGATLRVANEMGCYTLTDRGTWLAFKEKMGRKLELAILVEGDPILFNQYGIIAVNPKKCRNVKKRMAQQYVDWMTSPRAQRLIGSYKKFGEVLFTPNAKR
jgi:tungstate transport system substrate-binding protein